MTDPFMKRAKGDGIEMQLAEWGSGEKTVLCIHGLTANCRCWDRMAPALAREHRVLGVDLRGRGLSEKPAEGYSLEHHVRDIRKHGRGGNQPFQHPVQCLQNGRID